MNGDVLEVEEDIVRQCGSIKDIISEDRDEPIQIHNVNTAILNKVIEWCTYHRNDPPLQENREIGINEICPWDAEFLKVDDKTLIELVRAAYNLDIKVLMEVSCKTVAQKIRETMCPADLRDFFNGGVGQVQAENEWFDE